MIEIKGLTKKFGDFIAVDGISFSVKKGEIFGFLGPNGAGKTTTIRMLCGILEPTAGEGKVAGLDVKKEPDRVKSVIGYMSQKFSLYNDLTVLENIDFYAGIYGVEIDWTHKREILRMAGLEERCDEITFTLPPGFKQRLALSCARLHNPKVLFLDEPTAGVDPISRRDFWRLIKNLAKEGVTVLVTTHYMDEAEYCDRVCLIYNGRIIAEDAPKKLSDRMKWQLLELDCSDRVKALEILKRLSVCLDVGFYGKLLHVTVKSAEEASEIIEEELKKQNITITKLGRIIPPLEDVFVTLIDEIEKGRR